MADAPVPSHPRDTVLISHAMPEDSDFGLWLAVQLAQQGYRVWSEAAQLIGGERFWNDIQDAFRTSVIKLVYVVSRASVRKDGVQNELDYARTIARRLNMPPEKFIQAVLLDDLEEDELPIQLAGRNALFFSGSWSDGLSKLLKVLERDGIPAPLDTSQLGSWVRDRFSDGRRPVEREAKLTTNGCPIAAFPETIWFYEFDAPFDSGKPQEFRSFVGWPGFMHNRLLGTFADLAEVLRSAPLSTTPKVRASVRTLDYLADGCADPVVDRRSARNHVTGMLREAWDRFCEARALGRMVLSSRATGWFHPAVEGHERSYRFIDVDGRSRRKALNGVKTRKDADGARHVTMHWHFAPAARFSVGRENLMTLVPHVAFTTDGRHLLGEAAAAHKIRRSYCKSWFNEQWRTLHLAYVRSLAGEAPDISVPVAPNQAVSVSACPETLVSPAWFDTPPVRHRNLPDAETADAPADEGAGEEVPDEDVEQEASDTGGDWDEVDG